MKIYRLNKTLPLHGLPMVRPVLTTHPSRFQQMEDCHFPLYWRKIYLQPWFLQPNHSGICQQYHHSQNQGRLHGLRMFQFYDISNTNFRIQSSCSAPQSIICPNEDLSFDKGDPALDLTLSGFMGTRVTSFSKELHFQPGRSKPGL